MDNTNPPCDIHQYDWLLCFIKSGLTNTKNTISSTASTLNVFKKRNPWRSNGQRWCWDGGWWMPSRGRRRRHDTFQAPPPFFSWYFDCCLAMTLYEWCDLSPYCDFCFFFRDPFVLHSYKLFGTMDLKLSIVLMHRFWKRATPKWMARSSIRQQEKINRQGRVGVLSDPLQDCSFAYADHVGR